MTGRNRIGLISLTVAAAGFLFVTFQPWIALERVVLFRGLNLRLLLSAFFDASLVGALADWFAVSALFRNPLGVPLPHTNILAKNRETIAEAVPRFLSGFVSEEAIGAQLATVDFAVKVEQILADSSLHGEIVEFLRSRLYALLAAAVQPDGGPSESFAAVVRDIAAFAAERVDAAAATGQLLRWATAEGLDVLLLRAATTALRAAIEQHFDGLVDTITPMIKRNTGWQRIFVGRGTVERLLRGTQEELERVESDPGHGLRVLMERELASLSDRLVDGRLSERRDSAGSGTAAEKVRAAFRRFAEDQASVDKVARALAALRDRVRAALGPERTGFSDGVQRLEQALLSRLKTNPEFRGVFNRGVAGLISSLVTRSRVVEGVTGYLSGLLKNTDEREFVGRVEEAVWNDLQYIRVNGAVVGGIVGIVLAVLTGVTGR
jgi:uncharacterized membrane-anchored protein YjiN (DUF445 family)